MEKTEKVRYIFSSDTSGLTGAKDAIDDIDDSIKKADKDLDGMEGGANDVDEAIGGADSSAQSLGRTLAAIAVTFVSISAVKDVVGKAIGRIDTIHTAKKQLGLLFDDMEAGTKVADDLAEAIKGTPLAMDEVIGQATKLVSAGMEADKVKDSFQAIADVSFGDTQKIDQITNALSKMYTQGVITTNQMQSLELAGVPAFRILANEAGVSVDKIKESISDGTLDATKSIDMLVHGIENGTSGLAGTTAKYAGLAKVAGESIGGSFDNLKTSIVRNTANIIEPLAGPFAEAFNTAGQVVDIFGSTISSKLEPAVKSVSDNLEGLVSKVSEKVDKINNESERLKIADNIKKDFEAGKTEAGKSLEELTKNATDQFDKIQLEDEKHKYVDKMVKDFEEINGKPIEDIKAFREQAGKEFDVLQEQQKTMWDPSLYYDWQQGIQTDIPEAMRNTFESIKKEEESYHFGENFSFEGLEPLALGTFAGIGETLVNTMIPNLGTKIFGAITGLSAPLMATILGIFKGLDWGVLFGDLVSTAKSVGPPIIAIFSQVMDFFVKIGEKIAPIVQTLIEFILQIVEKLGPVFEQVSEIVTEVLGTVLEALDPIIEMIMQMVEEILPPLLEIIDELMPPIMEIVELVGEVVQRLVEALMPVISVIVELITKVIETIMPLITILISALMPLIEIVINIITIVVDKVVGIIEIIMKVVEVIISFLMPIIDTVIAVITGVLASAITIIIGIITNVMAVINIIIDVIGKVVGVIEGALKRALDMIMGPINTFKDGIDKAGEVVGGFIDWINDMIDGLKEAFEWVGKVGDKVGGFFGGIFGGSFEINENLNDATSSLGIPGTGVGGVPFGTQQNNTFIYNVSDAPTARSAYRKTRELRNGGVLL